MSLSNILGGALMGIGQGYDQIQEQKRKQKRDDMLTVRAGLEKVMLDDKKLPSERRNAGVQWLRMYGINDPEKAPPQLRQFYEMAISHGPEPPPIGSAPQQGAIPINGYGATAPPPPPSPNAEAAPGPPPANPMARRPTMAEFAQQLGQPYSDEDERFVFNRDYGIAYRQNLLQIAEYERQAQLAKDKVEPPPKPAFQQSECVVNYASGPQTRLLSFDPNTGNYSDRPGRVVNAVLGAKKATEEAPTAGTGRTVVRLVNGKPHDFQFTPKTGKYDQDLGEHYEKPESGPEAGYYIPLTDNPGHVIGAWNPKSGKAVEIPKEFAGARKSAVAGATNIKIADYENAARKIMDLGAAYKPEFVGPVAGRVERSKASGILSFLPFLKTLEGYGEFTALNADLKNAVIKLVTGAQMGVQEAQRILQQVPVESDKDEIWMAKYEQTRKNTEFLLNKIKELSGAGETGAQGGSGATTPPPSPVQVGQIVTIRGKQMKVTAVHPDGTFDAE